MADDFISYPGQPLLALFGPDYESVELNLRKIKVLTSPPDVDPQLKVVKKKDDKRIPTLEYAWGQSAIKDLTSYRRVESNFVFEPSVNVTNKRYTITVWEDMKDLHVECPTQWPELVKRTIEKNTDWDRKNIILHNKPYYAINDEYLLYPALYASIAANAAQATGSAIEMRAVGESARAGINVKRISWIKDGGNIGNGESDEMKVVAEQVDMKIDQGAFLFASEEYQRQAMTGLLPTYGVDRFVARINITKSYSHPASFCGSLGYSEALASTEYHASRLADYRQMTPYQLRNKIDKEKTKFTSYVPSVSISVGKKNTDHVFDASVFNRKWISNAYQKGDFGLVGYLRGIGMAFGMDVSGFSSKSCMDNHFSSVITFTSRKNITLNSSAPKEDYWKTLISEVFNKDAAQKTRSSSDTKTSARVQKDTVGIIFQDINQETVDSGPDVLSRFTSCYPMQLKKACIELNEARKNRQAPISVKFDAEGISESTEFNYGGFGTVVLELVVNRSDYKPIVKELWASFCFSKIPQNLSVKQTAKRSILNTLEFCGAVIKEDFKMHIDYTINKTAEDNLASIPSIARGLTMAAFANALYQIGGPEGSVLPASANRLEKVTIDGDEK